MSRRLFLSEFGRRTFAVAVLGTAVAACSSDDGSASATTAGGADDGAGGSAETTTTGGTEETAASADAALRWERADFGFVSAYVLARGNEVAIVDTGTEGDSSKIEEALSALSLGWADVDHVIVTHAHGDHFGGLDAVLTAAPDAMGYAGSADIGQLTAPRDLVSLDGGEEVFGLEIIHTPGHTPGHITAFDPGSGLLLAGDAMVTSDGALAGPSDQFSDDLDLANESVKALANGALGDNPLNTIVVGHGAPITDGADAELARLAAEL